MHVILRGYDLPGLQCGDYENVHVALQVGSELHQPVPGDAAGATWETDVVATIRDGSPDFRGPAVHGRAGNRFLYLTWGEVSGDVFARFRRAKLMLNDLGPGAIGATVAVGTISLTDGKGMPRCARISPPVVTWSLTSD